MVRRRRPGLFVVAPLASLTTLLAACGAEEAADVAEACGMQECPVGTAFKEKRSFSGGTDVGGGFDPSAGAVEGAFASFGTGDCEFICQAIQDCPAQTFPIITASCFTCGVILANDTVDRGDCED